MVRPEYVLDFKSSCIKIARENASEHREGVTMKFSLVTQQDFDHDTFLELLSCLLMRLTHRKACHVA